MTPGVSETKIQKCFAGLEMHNYKLSDFETFSSEQWETLGFSKTASDLLTKPTNQIDEQIARIAGIMADSPLKLVDISNPLFPTQLESFLKTPPFYLFLYGNIPLLKAKKFAVIASQGATHKHMQQVEAMTEAGVLKGETLVVGVNTDAYKRAAVVPLRWGAPRIIVLDRGLFAALGENLDQEMFPAARLWRYRFDPEVDLVVSFCRPDEEYRKGANQTRDRIVVGLADRLVAPYTRPKGTMATLAARAASLGRPVQMGASLDEN